jgi:hypothetical protein
MSIILDGMDITDYVRRTRQEMGSGVRIYECFGVGTRGKKLEGLLERFKKDRHISVQDSENAPHNDVFKIMNDVIGVWEEDVIFATITLTPFKQTF